MILHHRILHGIWAGGDSLKAWMLPAFFGVRIEVRVTERSLGCSETGGFFGTLFNHRARFS